MLCGKEQEEGWKVRASLKRRKGNYVTRVKDNSEHTVIGVWNVAYWTRGTKGNNFKILFILSSSIKSFSCSNEIVALVLYCLSFEVNLIHACHFSSLSISIVFYILSFMKIKYYAHVYLSGLYVSFF